MHIPDGYLSVPTVIATYAVAIPLWIIGFKKLKKRLNEETLPLIGALSALSFIVMMFNIPIPGGTSGHAIGATLIAILFNPWIGFISVSLVLLIQSVIFGDGGISALATNSIGMAFIGSFVGYYVFQLLQTKKYAPFIAGWAGIVASSLFIAIVLGIQPFWSENSKPLYFPFGLDVTIPALVVSHMLFFGVVEGIFTQLIYNYITNKNINLKEAHE